MNSRPSGLKSLQSRLWHVAIDGVSLGVADYGYCELGGIFTPYRHNGGEPGGHTRQVVDITKAFQ